MKLVKEWKHILYVALASYVCLHIVLYKESFGTVLKFSLGFVWFFLLPGWFLTIYWNWNVTQRLLIGIFLSAALTGIFSYYTGLWFLPLSKQVWLWPIVWMVAGYYFSTKASPSNAIQNQSPKE